MHQAATVDIRPADLDHRQREIFRWLMATAMLTDAIVAILFVPVLLVLGILVGGWLWPFTPIFVGLAWLPPHGLSALVLVVRCVRVWNESPTFCVWLAAGILGYVLPPLLGGLAFTRIWTAVPEPFVQGVVLGSVLCLQFLSYAVGGVALVFARGIPPGGVVHVVATLPVSLIVLWVGAYLLLVPP